MNNPIELPFQVSLALGIVVFLLLRMYYFFRSRILRDFLPVAFENRWVRIFGIVAMLAWAAVVILWLVRADWLAWSAVTLPEWLRWLGVVLMTTGLGLMTWAYETLGRSFHPMPDACPAPVNYHGTLPVDAPSDVCSHPDIFPGGLPGHCQLADLCAGNPAANPGVGLPHSTGGSADAGGIWDKLPAISGSDWQILPPVLTFSQG